LLILLFSTGFSFAQYSDQGLFSGLKINPGIGFDYFSRTVMTKGEDTTNRIKGLFLTLNTEFEINDGFSITALLGYSFTNYNSMTFQKLPVSLELDVGSIGSFLAGIRMNKNILRMRNLEMDVFGRVIYSLGKDQTWEIPSLSVEGTAIGKPSWLAVQTGPVITYTGFAYFLPYVNISYNKIWGKFRMNETIENLTGSEEKILTGRSDLSLSIGFVYEVFQHMTFKAEGTFMPHSDFKNSDYGSLIRIIYVFN